MQPIPFAQQSYKDASKDISVQRLVNMYVQPKGPQSKSQTALHGTPGLKPWATVGDGPIRGMLGMGSYLYVVSGRAVFRVDSAGDAVERGSVVGNGAVCMAGNGQHIVITTNTAPVYAVGETDFYTLSIENSNGVAFQDGYICLAERGSQKFFISGLNDALTYDPLDYTLVNAQPDLNVGIANANREIWVFNERTAQVYYNSGNADFPFTRNPSGIVETGCAAERSISSFQGSVFWLGDDFRVYVSQGYAARPISTPPIDAEISGLSGKSSAIGFVYAQLGHIFYVLTFPNQRTYCYDVVTGLWHERQSPGGDDWRARGYQYWFGRYLVGDSEDGALYELDHDTYTDDGEQIHRIMTSPVLHANRQRMFFRRLELDFENGVGLETGQGSNPQVMLSWTDDGGRTYSGELWRSLGVGGKYRWRTSWQRLGSSFERSYKLELSDPVKAVVIEAFHDVQIGGLR